MKQSLSNREKLRDMNHSMLYVKQSLFNRVKLKDMNQLVCLSCMALRVRPNWNGSHDLQLVSTI